MQILNKTFQWQWRKDTLKTTLAISVVSRPISGAIRIGETFFILPHPPILSAFYNNEKNILFIVIEQAISQ